ncbi:hypothetical protein E1301_Tti009636 [Triplophysa tibetana]|uniref:Uncharacterized protein n=1 Tax=Triplophysa tibetana TaxID=1572043 RepID=A0A5A9NFN5_9TELE|nr:hypothetical protein E1301_Tti009636 [Triplophysa tibetana]
MCAVRKMEGMEMKRFDVLSGEENWFMASFPTCPVLLLIPEVVAEEKVRETDRRLSGSVHQNLHCSPPRDFKIRVSLPAINSFILGSYKLAFERFLAAVCGASITENAKGCKITVLTPRDPSCDGLRASNDLQNERVAGSSSASCCQSAGAKPRLLSGKSTVAFEALLESSFATKATFTRQQDEEQSLAYFLVFDRWKIALKGRHADIPLTEPCVPAHEWSTKTVIYRSENGHITEWTATIRSLFYKVRVKFAKATVGKNGCDKQAVLYLAHEKCHARLKTRVRKRSVLNERHGNTAFFVNFTLAQSVEVEMLDGSSLKSSFAEL